jgi:hypothetical protein
MAAVIRTRIARRFFGEGMGGVVASSLVSWGLAKLGEGLRHEEEVLDVSKLRVGETYTIVTRPAPTREERKLAVRSAKADEKARKAERPTAAQRRTARSLERAQRKANRTKPHTRRGERRRRQANELEVRYRREAERTPRQRELRARADAAQAAYEAARGHSLERSRRKARPERRRVWQDR